jgi:hypothetical protein
VLMAGLQQSTKPSGLLSYAVRRYRRVGRVLMAGLHQSRKPSGLLRHTVRRYRRWDWSGHASRRPTLRTCSTSGSGSMRYHPCNGYISMSSLRWNPPALSSGSYIPMHFRLDILVYNHCAMFHYVDSYIPLRRLVHAFSSRHFSCG